MLNVPARISEAVTDCENGHDALALLCSWHGSETGRNARALNVYARDGDASCAPGDWNWRDVLEGVMKSPEAFEDHPGAALLGDGILIEFLRLEPLSGPPAATLVVGMDGRAVESADVPAATYEAWSIRALERVLPKQHRARPARPG